MKRQPKRGGFLFIVRANNFIVDGCRHFSHFTFKQCENYTDSYKMTRSVSAFLSRRKKINLETHSKIYHSVNMKVIQDIEENIIMNSVNDVFFNETKKSTFLELTLDKC